MLLVKYLQGLLVILLVHCSYIPFSSYACLCASSNRYRPVKHVISVVASDAVKRATSPIDISASIKKKETVAESIQLVEREGSPKKSDKSERMKSSNTKKPSSNNDKSIDHNYGEGIHQIGEKINHVAT